MMKPTCFVIMPIGDQHVEGAEVSSQELRRLYDDLIREALVKARPDLQVVRADDIAAPGGIRAAGGWHRPTKPRPEYARTS